MNETRNRILLFLFPLLLMAGCGHRETAPNIVLVTLDTTRPDYLGCYGNDWVETPTLDRVASEGVLFEDAVCQIPTTLSSHTAILTSLYPRTSGVRSGVVIVPDEVTTLAEHLKTQGYQTAAFVAAAVLEKKYNLDQGFDVYNDGPFHPVERPAAEVNEKVLEWLEGTHDPQKPSFLWIHYYDPHSPYSPPQKWVEKYTPNYKGPINGSADQITRLIASRGQIANATDLEHLRGLYAGEISQLDQEIGEFLEKLRKKLPAENTILSFMADHGEELGEHNNFFHGEHLYEPAVRIPWIMTYPNKIPAGSKVTQMVHSLDFVPTLLALAGLPPMNQSEGFDLSTAILTQSEPERGNLVSYLENEDDRFLDEGDKVLAARSARWKFIENSNHKRPETLFGKLVNEDLDSPMFAQVFIKGSSFASIAAHIRYHTDESHPLRHEYPDLASIPTTMIQAIQLGVDPLHSEAAQSGVLETPNSGWRVSVTPNLYERARDYALTMGYETKHMVIESLVVNLAIPWNLEKTTALVDNLELIVKEGSSDNVKWKRRVIADMESGETRDALKDTGVGPKHTPNYSWAQESAFPGPRNLSQRIEVTFEPPPPSQVLNELYDLQTDPKELDNLMSPEAPTDIDQNLLVQIRDGMTDRLENWKEGASSYNAEAASLSAEDRANLKAIGYFE
ncbi:MAG: sulfatase [Candidatus Omnitrophica bacterium]|nr:sulfatase [Candidatus Omnitrophota bacterium]